MERVPRHDGNIPRDPFYQLARESLVEQGLPGRCRTQLIEQRVDKSKSSTRWLGKKIAVLDGHSSKRLAQHRCHRLAVQRLFN